MFTVDLLRLYKPTVRQIAGGLKCKHWGSCLEAAGRNSAVAKKAGFVSLPPNEGRIRTAANLRKSNLRAWRCNAATSRSPGEGCTGNKTGQA